MINNMQELTQAEDMAYFRADLCLYSPECYTLEEKREICQDMMSTSKAIEDAMRADFESMPPELRVELLDMLCESGSMTPEWWRGVLLGEVPDSPDSLIMQGDNSADFGHGRVIS